MHIQISRSPGEPDATTLFWLSVSGDQQRASVYLFEHPAGLQEFGRSLSSYKGSLGNQPLFEYGSPEEPNHAWVRLQVFPIDNLGHSAMQVSMKINGARHVQTSAHFSIQMEVAAINSLGHRLAEWAASSSEDFEFHESER